MTRVKADIGYVSKNLFCEQTLNKKFRKFLIYNDEEKYTLRFRAKVVEKSAVSGNMKGKARKHGIQASQIRAWRRNTDFTLEQAEKYPKKLSLNKCPKLENEDLEIQVYNLGIGTTGGRIGSFQD